MEDQTLLRELGKRLSQIAALPIQQQKRDLWIAHNSLGRTRPLVCIDQLPWHEINRSDEMKLECEDVFLRSVEWDIKSLLYRWNHFACDMVIENRIDIPMCIHIYTLLACSIKSFSASADHNPLFLLTIFANSLNIGSLSPYFSKSAIATRSRLILV